jgi:hypothetical protein
LVVGSIEQAALHLRDHSGFRVANATFRVANATFRVANATARRAETDGITGGGPNPPPTGRRDPQWPAKIPENKGTNAAIV